MIHEVKMKKIISVLIGIALLLTLITPAIGGSMYPEGGYTLTQETDNGQITGEATREVLVKFNVYGEMYYVSIPSDITFTGKDDYIDHEVSITKITLSGDREVQVNVKSKHGWEMMQHDGDDLKVDENQAPLPGIHYTMTFYNGDELAQQPASTDGNKEDIMIISANALSEITSKKIRFTMIENPPNTGAYKDTLTFTSKVVNPSA